MPLLDHFRPPLRTRRQWHSFHQAWAVNLAEDLNTRLPEAYYAEPNVHYGIEIDVAAFEEEETPEPYTWQPAAPTLTVPLTALTDLIEVQVMRHCGGPMLAGAIELVSPANKDRPAHRDAFATKAASYLQQGIGLLIVDVVTERTANLHDRLMRRVSPTTQRWGAKLYAAAYRPLNEETEGALDMWLEALALGASLPTLPFWMRGGFFLPIDLEATYRQTCQKLRISA